MPKNLPPLPPPQDSVPCPKHPVSHQLPTDKRQQCHALMAQLLIHVSYSATSEECKHEHQG